MLKIYGHPQTSANRCFWMLEELELAYENVPVNLKNKDQKKDDYLKINPNGKVPCLVEGDFILWESMAINHYLAEKYRPSLLGDSTQERAHILQWNYWSLAEYQRPMIDLFIQTMFVPEPHRDLDLMKKSEEKVLLLNEMLDRELGKKGYLVRPEFSLADLNVASVAKLNRLLKISTESLKNFNAWFNPICERPAFLKADQMT